MRANVLAVVTLTIFFTAHVPGHADLGPRPPEPDRLWFGLCTQSPIPYGGAYEHDFAIFIPGESAGKPVPCMKLEIKRARDQKPVAALAFEPFGDETCLPLGFSTSADGLPRDARQQLADLPEGEYAAAITTVGERCSNVSRFLIQPGVDPKERPVLEAVALEPPPYCELPLFGLRVTGSQDLKETFRFNDACFPDLIVDGVRRRRTLEIHSGGNPALRNGTRWTIVISAGGYLAPPIEPGEPHKLEVRVGEYRSEPIDFDPGRPEGEAWDAETPW